MNLFHLVLVEDIKGGSIRSVFRSGLLKVKDLVLVLLGVRCVRKSLLWSLSIGKAALLVVNSLVGLGYRLLLHLFCFLLLGALLFRGILMEVLGDLLCLRFRLFLGLLAWSALALVLLMLKGSVLKVGFMLGKF